MRILSLVLAVLALVGTSAIAIAQSPLTLTFMPGRNGTQAGTVTLADMGAQTKVTIAVATGGAGVSQPAHIHVGACPGVGAVVFPLTSVVDGKSETTVNVALATLRATQHAINIHKSASEAAVYTACAEIPSAAASLPRTGGLPIGLVGIIGAAIAGMGFAFRRRA